MLVRYVMTYLKYRYLGCGWLLLGKCNVVSSRSFAQNQLSGKIYKLVDKFTFQ